MSHKLVEITTNLLVHVHTPILSQEEDVVSHLYVSWTLLLKNIASFIY